MPFLESERNTLSEVSRVANTELRNVNALVETSLRGACGALLHRPELVQTDLASIYGVIGNIRTEATRLNRVLVSNGFSEEQLVSVQSYIRNSITTELLRIADKKIENTIFSRLPGLNSRNINNITLGQLKIDEYVEALIKLDHQLHTLGRIGTAPAGTQVKHIVSFLETHEILSQMPSSNLLTPGFLPPVPGTIPRNLVESVGSKLDESVFRALTAQDRTVLSQLAAQIGWRDYTDDSLVILHSRLSSGSATKMDASVRGHIEVLIAMLSDRMDLAPSLADAVQFGRLARILRRLVVLDGNLLNDKAGAVYEVWLQSIQRFCRSEHQYSSLSLGEVVNFVHEWDVSQYVLSPPQRKEVYESSVRQINALKSSIGSLSLTKLPTAVVAGFATPQIQLSEDAQRNLLSQQIKYINEKIKQLTEFLNANAPDLTATDAKRAKIGEYPITADMFAQEGLEAQPPQWLFDAGKKVLEEYLTHNLVMHTNEAKSDDYRLFTKITTALERHDERWKRKSQYLKDRLQLFAACLAGTTSNMTLNYKGLLEGQDGWLGAKVTSEIDAGHPLRLLYGHEVNLDLSSADPEEARRIKVVNIVLEHVCKYYGEFNPATKTKGRFHATTYFTKSIIADFKNALKADLAASLGLASAAQLTSEQIEAFGVGWDLHTLLDLRTHYALPFYMGGWSPQDDIRKTIGEAAEIAYRGKDMYLIAGKGHGMVDPTGAICHFGHEVIDTIDRANLKNNFRFAEEVATPAWLSWMAPHLDEGVADHHAHVVFELKSMVSPVPQMFDAFWLPRKPGENPVMGDTALKLMTASVKGQNPGEYAMQLDALLEGRTAVNTFMKACESGFAPSDNMESDVTRIKEAITKMADQISPSKALGPTINARFIANGLYTYCRNALISFGKKHKYDDKGEERKDYWKNYSAFLRALRAGVTGAPTMGIEIAASDLPAQFRSRYGLPAGKLPVMSYVLALLPDSYVNFISTNKMIVDSKMMVRGSKVNRRISREVAESIKASVMYRKLRERATEHRLEVRRGQRRGLEKITEATKLVSLGPDLNPALEADWSMERGPHENRDGVTDFYLDVYFPPYEKPDKEPGAGH